MITLKKLELLFGISPYTSSATTVLLTELED